MFRGAFSRMFTAAGCHGRPWLRIAFETLQVSARGLPSSLRSHYCRNPDHFSSFKKNDKTHMLSVLECVWAAPFKNEVVRSVRKSGLGHAPCANFCLFSVGCLLNQPAGEKGHVLSLPPESSVLGSLRVSDSSLFHLDSKCGDPSLY